MPVRESGQPTWRNVTVAERPQAGPQWRRALQRKRRRSRRRLRQLGAALVLVSFLAFLAAFVYVSCWWWPPRAARLVLVGATYHDNLAIPENVAGWNTLVRLAHFAHGGGLRLASEPFRLEAQADWSSKLDEGAERAIIIYFAVHGGADPQGAYLLPHDASANANRLRLEQVLDRLAKLAAERHKLLVLDAGGIDADWSLGMMENGFVRALVGLEARIAAVPNLVVLSASGPDERCWNIPELGETAFGRFFALGLAGAADDNRDGRIDGWELYQYARREVGRWAWQNRGVTQTPLLLPLGETGQRRALATELAAADGPREPDRLSAPATFEPPAGLRQQWERYGALSRSVPPPSAVVPRHWQQYQALLLRYDQLVRAGAGGLAEPLALRLEQLHGEFAAAGGWEISSFSSSLAMPTAAAEPVQTTDAEHRALAKLWAASPKDTGKLWASLQQALAQPRRERLAYLDLLLQRVAEAPAANLEKGYALFELLRDPVFPAPVELHFLSMLERDLPAPLATVQADLVALALDVRRAAEQAVLGLPAPGVPFSVEVLPRIAPLIEQADRPRRLAEDLLFSADAGDWQTARTSFLQARTDYQGAVRRANVVQRALAARNRAYDELPHLSLWLARRRPIGEPQWQQADAALLLAAEQLWKDAHRLAELLDEPADSSASAATAYAALDQQAAVVDRGLRLLQEEHGSTCQRLLTIAQPELWLEVEAALLVPGLDPALRLELLGHQRRVSRQRLLESTGSGAAPAHAFAELESAAKSRGTRNARLASARIGRDWFDRCTGAGLENYVQTMRRIETFAVEEKWHESLARAGEQMARRLWWAPGAIERQVAEAQAAAETQAYRTLSAADRLSRLVPPAVEGPMAADPTRALTQLLRHRLLLFQAERTLRDRWYSRDPSAAPYFQTAGLAYLADADNLGLGDQARQRAAKMRAQIEQAKGLALEGPAQVSLTSETEAALDISLAALGPAGGLEGYVTLSVKAGERIELADPPAGRRLVRQLAGEGSAALVRCQVTNPLAAGAERQPPAPPVVLSSFLTVEGLFRGQRFDKTVPVALQPLADVVVRRHPPPERAALAVRAAPEVHDRYGAARGAIAIVLDCSGSMGPVGEEFTSDTKYAEATRALRAVLGRLPKGVTVSVWVFGQAVGPDKTVTDVESTIRRVADPIVWNPEDAAQLDDVMDRIEYPALEPWNTSPVVRALLAAREDLRGAAGFKTLVALTDGMDNRFLEDKTANPNGLDIPSALRQAFDGTGIVIDMVGFKVAGSEEEIARAQFNVVEQLTPPGRWHSVADAGKLVEVLDGALKQRLRYRLETGFNVVAEDTRPEGYDASRAGDNNQWLAGGVPPGAYRLVVHADRRLSKTAVVDGGDLLLVDLVPSGPRLDLVRGVYSLEDRPAKPAYEKSGWRVALLQNQLGSGGSVELLAAVEKLRTPAETALAVVRPRNVWWELAPVEPADTPYLIEWFGQTGYPAPAWTLRATGWPQRRDAATPIPLRLGLWWEPDQEPFPAAVVKKTHDYRSPADLAGRALRIGAAAVTIESLGVEDHTVQTGPARLERQPCLVVRARCPGAGDIWVELEGITPAGQEHRYFRQSGRYTALFWPVARDQAEQSLAGVKLYSVAEFKRQAERRGYALEATGLVPKPGDVRPPRIVP